MIEPVENLAEMIASIRALVADDLHAIDDLIQQELISSVSLTRDITQHIFKGKSKRLRPLLLVLAAHAVCYPSQLDKRHFELAVVIEFVHTATLLHDDVVDHSEKRRGQRTANAIWGNLASVLVGDFLYSRAFQILARHAHVSIMRVLSEATNAIAEGEVMQLMNQKNPHLSEENYFHIITQKTAKLFSAASEIGAILQNANETQQKTMTTLGLHLGIAFQVIDDLLDYDAESKITGKNIGDDLAEGKTTLPLIYAMKRAPTSDAQLIREAIQSANIHVLSDVMAILKKTQALSDTYQKALEHANIAFTALQFIPDSVYRQALQRLISFSVERKY